MAFDWMIGGVKSCFSGGPYFSKDSSLLKILWLIAKGLAAAFPMALPVVVMGAPTAKVERAC